ncbi:MAG: sulfatase [Chromatocurvus sp.]
MSIGSPWRLIGAGLIVWLCCGAGLADTAAPRPNIVFILADDLGYGDIGANGSTLISTPNIDALASEGARLTSFYAPANVCTPSRAGFLTGRQPVRMGLAKDVIRPGSSHGLPATETTLATLLRGAGYRTAMIGKWHLGNQAPHWPTSHGFDEFLGVPYSNDMSPFPLYRDEEVIEASVDQTTLTARYTEEAVALIEESGDRPFFLYFAHTFPHIPLFSGPPFRGQSGAGLYGDTVETIDWSVGQLIDALERSGQRDNTLIVFTSDNGPWFEGSAGVSRDRKGGTWDGAYRVPFVAYWPSGLPRGQLSDEPVSGLDLLPTLARLAGAETDHLTLDGRDIWPVLSQGAPTPHDELLFFNEDQIAAVRSGDWRLVLRGYYKIYEVPLGDRGYPLLFNLASDPGENYSLAPDQPDEVARLLAIVAQARKQLAVPPPPPFPPAPPRTD